jgi:hypothetical protein
MARYILVQVDENSRATALMKKLEPVEGIKVIGLFGKPTNFCDDVSHRNPNESSQRGKKYGWSHCRTCGLPKKNIFHMLTNLLDPPEMYHSVRLRDIFLNIREPYVPALEKYGQAAFDIQMAKARHGAELLEKMQQRNDPEKIERRRRSRERRAERKRLARNSS